MKHLVLRLAFGSILAVGFSISAHALTASCQAELDKYGQARLEVINKINGFAKKRPTAKQACAIFGELVKAEAEMLKWMEDNQAWCQLPDPFVADYKKGTEQGTKARAQVCTAAKKQQQQPRAPSGPAPGSGVRLPKGAL